MINIEKSQYPKTDTTRSKTYAVLEPFRVLFVALAACLTNYACYLSYLRPFRAIRLRAETIPRAICRTCDPSA
eukprot:1452828-Heterocapsa_arctica.AAC.1